MRVPFILLALIGFNAAANAADQHPAASAGGLFQVLFGLIVVLALMATAAWAMKRFGVVKAASSATVKVVGGVSVGNRERILVVEVAEQWIVVGVAPGHITTLSTMPRQENSAATEDIPTTRNFSSWLKQTMERRNGKSA